MKYMPPNYFQSTFSSIILVSLSLLFLPATLSLSVFALVYGVLTGSLISFTREDTETKRESVLITGARANKALTLIRAFKRANYRVIVAEEEEWRFCCARFSLAVDAFYTLPSPRSPSGTQPYIDAIKRIVQDEEVVFWVPCSTMHATMEDAEAARQIRQLDLGGGSNSYCETFIPHPDLTATIHWKGKLNNLLVELGIPVPNSKVVTTTAQALDFIYSPTTLEKGYQYILKCISLDDLGRDNMTLLPLSTRADTREHLKKMPTPISKEIPFMVQRYLRGVEYCTHVAARDGDIVAFVACPSNPLLMRYVDARNLGDEGKRRSAEMEAWVRDFLQKWKHKLGSEGKEGWQAELTGHFSFDFIYDENDEKWYPLACNARAHTAITLLSDIQTLAESYITKPSVADTPPLSRPPKGSSARSWLAHALPISIIRSLLRLPPLNLIPNGILAFLHPALPVLALNQGIKEDPTASPPPLATPLKILWTFFKGTFLPSICFGREGGERDPYWDYSDPVPFLVIASFTWVWVFVNLAVRGEGWKLINVSTGRVFKLE